MTNLFKIISASLFVLLLNGCGNSSGSSGETSNTEKQYAYLIDSAVEGVDFETSLKNGGQTDSEGKLEFNSDAKTVSFSIGELKLFDFELSKLNKDKKIYITDLVGVSRNDSSNEDVIKVLRVLQTLDDDGNPSNGIRITQNIKNTLDTKVNIVDTNSTELENLIKTKTTKDLISSSQAQEHFEDTLTKELGYTFSRDFKSGDKWKNITYNTVTSTRAYTSALTTNGKTYPIGTKRVWLDRNLGASQVCTSRTDTNCYGDYYQWGRNADGHEKSNSATSSTQATNVLNVGHGKFIATSSNEWASTDSNRNLRTANWSKTDGTSICPKGYRVPIKDEIEADTRSNGVTNRDEAFSNFLKIPSAGFRDNTSGSLNEQGNKGYMWSTLGSGSSSEVLRFIDTHSNWFYDINSKGHSVRCIKH